MTLLLALLISPGAACMGTGDGRSNGPRPVPAAETKLPRTEVPYTSVAASPPDTSRVQASENVTFGSSMWSVRAYRVGYILSVPYTVHEAKRWDYAAVFPVPVAQQCKVTLTVLDPDGTPEQGLPGEVLARVDTGPNQVVNADLRGIDPDAHARVQLHIALNDTVGSQPLGITGFRVGDCDLDLWHDPFYGNGREESTGNLSLGDGMVTATDLFLPGGIKGDYYDNRDFTAYRYTHLDPVIDFDWGNGGPANIGPDTFSIRWNGRINIVRPGMYTFYLRIDDGGRLWIDGNQLIDKWFDQGATEYPATVNLARGLHNVTIEYHENHGGALCQLRWSGPGIVKQIVPQRSLWGRDAINVLVSDRISVSAGQTWDLLMIKSFARGQGFLYVDVLDAATDQTLAGLENISVDAVDLSGVQSSITPAIKLRAKWDITDVSTSPVLVDLAVNWKPLRTWRTEFLSDIGIRGHVGLSTEYGYIERPRGQEACSQIAFAERFDGYSTTVSSSLYTGWLRDGGVMTTNASDVAMGDLDGDGVLDVLYTSSDPGANASAYKGYGGGFEDAPMYIFAHSQESGDNSTFGKVLVADLGRSGGPDDVLIAELSANKQHSRLLRYWPNTTGTTQTFNATPDEVIGGLLIQGTVTDISVGDIDGDQWRDVAFTTYDQNMCGVYVLWGSSSGYSMSNSVWLRDCDAYSVCVGRINGDSYDDLFTGCYNFSGDPSKLTTNLVAYGTPQRANLKLIDVGGVAANAMTILDWFGNGTKVLALVQDGNVTLHVGTDPVPFSTYVLWGATGLAPIDYGSDGNQDLAVSVAEDPDVPVLRDYGIVGSWLIARLPGGTILQHQLPTDGAVAVVSGSMFGVGVGALRTGKIDLGDPRYVGMWDQLKYRVAGEQVYPGQEVTLRVLDGETERELLNRTGSSIEGTFDISSIKVKEHPTIFLEAYLSNVNDSMPLDLGALSVNWTERKAAPPTVLSLTADKPVIYRTNGTTLHVTVDDEFDTPQELRILVQVRPAGSLGWTDAGLGKATWDGKGYTLTFTTTRSYIDGNYSFRARATDTDMMDSAWLEEDGLVRVLNNPPGAPVIELQPSAPRTSDDIRCVIVRQAFDLDTLSLDYVYSWSRDGVHVPEVSASSVPSNMTKKGQTWSVVVRAFDGEDYGPHVSANVTVVNTPPLLLRPLAPVLMDEDSPPVRVDLGAYFSDPDGDTLTFAIHGFTNLTASLDPLTHAATVSTLPDWWGLEVGEVGVSDGSASVLARLEVDVRSIPDAPVIVSIGGRVPVDGIFHLVGLQDHPEAFLVVVLDPDSVSFTFRTDAKMAWLTVNGANGTVTIHPNNDAVGRWGFNLSCQDETGESDVVPVELVIENVNDPPGLVYILQPKNNKVFQANDTILLQGSCSDPDERLGEVLNFTWSSNMTGVLGYGTSLSIKGLLPGDHVITLIVTDGVYIKRSYVKIRVLNPVKPPPGDGGGGGGEPYIGPRALASTTAIVGALLLVIIVIIVAIAIVLRQRAKQQALQEERTWRAEARPVPETAVGVPPGPTTPTGIRVEQPRDMRSLMTEPSPRPPVDGPRPAGPSGWELKKPPPRGGETVVDWQEF